MGTPNLPPVTATVPRQLTVGQRRFPVVLPNRRDPRLHTAAVILSIHTIGILFLGFEVSVPQILSAIVTAALVDIVFTVRRTGQLVWPASGMLTGSGVALILRYVPTGAGEFWSWSGWYWFAAVAGASVLTKHLVRWRGDHIFNPSNLGLVVAFLVIGREVVEPLDFWWAPLGAWMLIAYALIIGGGTVITRRLHLLEMAIVFWVVFVSGIGVLSASGHCMVTTWSTTPVCDERFWATLATSPEVLIFMFFMITDPKTVPFGRAPRVAFAATLAVVATLLIAPQTLEYGSKVALLGTLVLWSPLRWAFDRIFATRGEGAGLPALVARLAGTASRPFTVFGRGLVLGSLTAVLALAIVLAGTPARDSAVAAVDETITVPVRIDEGAIPEVTVDDSVAEVDFQVDQAAAHEVAVMLAEDLALEAEAIRTVDASLLAIADGGERLTEIQARIDDGVTNGERIADEYEFDSLLLRVSGEEEGQTSAALAFEARGTLTSTTYDSSGHAIERVEAPFEGTFILRQLAGERWLIVRANSAD